MATPGYTLVDTLYTGAHTVTTRARRDRDGRAVLLRVPADLESASDVARIRHEYEIIKAVGRERFIASPEVKRLGSGPIIVTEDPGGVPLRRLVGPKGMDLASALWIGAELADRIGELHKARIVHKDVNGRNALVDVEARSAVILGFDAASRLPRETYKIVSPEVLEGTLAYISPEQTGRMNRAIDYRTDLYSLGVTLYEMLTGELPFRAGDPLELVHAHIAKSPIPPHERAPKVPRAVSDIVMKLMAKNAEDRYQSSHGVALDLRACARELEERGSVGLLVLGQSDWSDVFQPPQKLYGRDREITALMAAFDRATAGRRELVLISGWSGIGKTVLVNEIHRPVVRERGFFISGKFEQYKRDIPYLALTQAFRELMRQLLTGSAATVARWRDRMLAAFGQDGRVIVDVIPEVGLIVGEQPEVVPLGPTDAQNRFRALFKNFMQVFAAAEHPLVVFLDDLQWADSASLKLLELLMTDPDDASLLLVASYRDNEVDEAHPLRLALAELEKAGAAVTPIHVGPLGLEHVEQIVADTHRCDREVAAPLARLLLEKTLGNPFFIIQFLKALHDEGLVRFDPDAPGWTWDTDEIRRRTESTSNVVDLMVERIQKLPTATQDVLKLAASIGAQFDLRTLALITQRTALALASDLWAAVAEGQVIPLMGDLSPAARSTFEAGRPRDAATSLPRVAFTASGTHSISDLSLTIEPDDEDDASLDVSYRFLHDRVQQAAYSLVEEGERKRLHLTVGRLLLRGTAPGDLEDRIFDIVNHLDLCVDLIDDAAERRRLAELNLIAGKKARASTAYDLAARHLSIAAELLPAGSWETDYDLTLAIASGRSECEYLLGRFDAADRLFDDVLAHARTALEKVAIHTLRTTLYRHTAKYQEAVGMILAGLRLSGFDLPAPDDAAKMGAIVGQLVGELSGLLAGREVTALIDLPDMTDRETLAKMELLEELSIVAIFMSPLLLQVATFEMVILSLRHGNARASSSAYGAYGALLGSGMGDFKTGHAFGKLAVELSRKHGDPRAGCRSGVWQGVCVSHWREHVGSGIATLKEACDLGIRSGDPAYASYAALFVIVHSFLRGDALDDVLIELPRYRRYMDAESRRTVIAYRQLARSLKGQTRGAGELGQDDFDEAAYKKELATYSVLALQHYYAVKTQALFLAGRVDEALAACDESVALGDIDMILFGQLAPAAWAFYRALALAAGIRASEGDLRRSREEAFEKATARLTARAENCPANFEHERLLVSAEAAANTGRELDAMELYEAAIESARANGFTQKQALAAELAAGFHERQGRRGAARRYLSSARDGYRRWGATDKARQIEARNPDLEDAQAPAGEGRAGVSIDIAAVTKASQAISGEIVLRRLLQRMMRIMIENAGAERGHFILERNGDFFVEATGTSSDDEIAALGSVTLERFPDLARSIVNYVERTGDKVVLDDAANEGRFTNDPYVVSARPKSILCTPILKQKRRVGILYLENNLVAGAFTLERLRLLDVLSTQAAISLENAYLYDTLEQKVAERTRELMEKNGELESAMRRLTETQRQLVVQEKLASLGALTAGIAHEIKNPLNFITNFAELTVELTGQLREELDAERERLDPGAAEAIREILTDVEQNVVKINQHGRRADGIVTAMLEHSRGGSGEKRATDVNAIIAEFASLAAQGQRSRDPRTAMVLEASYDDALGPAWVDPQEFGRVVLNLVNNAWYAARAKERRLGEGFAPLISVRTRDLGRSVEIRVRDNGDGIPPDVVDKIYNPFFTTKPTGDGTGLGLSISHDIIVESSGGSIRVETEPGQFAEFIVTLPKPAGEGSDAGC